MSLRLFPVLLFLFLFSFFFFLFHVAARVADAGGVPRPLRVNERQGLRMGGVVLLVGHRPAVVQMDMCFTWRPTRDDSSLRLVGEVCVCVSDRICKTARLVLEAGAAISDIPL